MRALTKTGTDLGFVYGTSPFTFTVSGAPSVTLPLNMLLLKEQPPGSPARPPVLVWRTILSGEPYPCPLFYESADCTATAGWPVVSALASGASCVAPDGHVYAADFSVDPVTVIFNSRRSAAWDTTTLRFVWPCAAGSGTATNVFAGVDEGVLPTVPSGVHYVPAD